MRLKNEDEILKQIDELEKAFLNRDVDYDYYQGYKNALYWVLKWY